MVEILRAGLYDSIQDLGRYGYQHFGVPISGAMDHYSAKLANAILGNTDHAAVLEFTLLGPKLKFHIDTAICITGMVSKPQINGESIENGRYALVKKDDVLSFGKKKLGCRGYLAVMGGFQTEQVMGSRSFYGSITNQQRLRTGDVLQVSNMPVKRNRSNTILKTPRSHFESDKLHVFNSVDFELLNHYQRNVLFNNKFTISKDSNRMAYQLEETLENNLNSIITAPVLPGTIQLTPSGQLMLLMRDGQTTGGYPRILQLSEMAINRLSQKNPDEKIQFKIVIL